LFSYKNRSGAAATQQRQFTMK